MSDRTISRIDMTDDQRECFDLLCTVFRGEHHVPMPIRSFGRGIKCNTNSSRLATYDFDELTRLVVLAHERMVRVEITTAGPGRVVIVLHKRHKRDGYMHERHPTIEEAVASVRGQESLDR